MNSRGRPRTQGGPCKVLGCPTASVIKGMCRKHYHQLQRTGRTWELTQADTDKKNAQDENKFKARHDQGQAAVFELRRLYEAYNHCFMDWKARVRLRQQINALEAGTGT